MPKLLPFSAFSPSSPQESSLRLPANKRFATPVSHRLTSITDPEASANRTAGTVSTSKTGDAADAGVAASSTPRRRSLASIRLALPLPRRESGSSKISHPAPPYDWVPEPIEEDLDGRVPVEGKKLRQLRNEDDEGKMVLWWRRKRAVLFAVVLLLLVAIVIGLGVGLSHRNRAIKKAAGAGNMTETPLQFPLGQWTVGATLVDAITGCTGNPDIWRCYPYTVGGETAFDLTITNSSALYAPNSTIGAAGSLPANLTISSSNPFVIPFTNQSMTYVASATNRTAARLEWSFEMAKSVMPSAPMMDGGSAAECTFTAAMLTGILYLNAVKASAAGMNGRGDWPYAVEIRQSAQASDGAVECSGVRGGSMSVAGADGVCDCVYRNY